MPKPTLIPEQQSLQSDLLETMLEGLRRWRPDLAYPESHSDMQACVMAVMSMFEIKRRPLAVPLKVPCHECEGLGHLVMSVDGGCRDLKTCPRCNGRRHLPYEV